MAPLIVSIRDLPDAPLDAAAFFHEHIIPGIRVDLSGVDEVHLLFEPADHSHEAWRLAAVQALAREAAPVRVNAIVGGDRDAVKQAQEYLAIAPGVTGQIFETAAHQFKTA